MRRLTAIYVHLLMIGLIRLRKVSWHRFLGWFGAGLAATMVVLGCLINVVMTRFHAVRLHEANVESFMSDPVRRHARVWRVCGAGHLLEEAARLPSQAHVRGNLPAHGRGLWPLYVPVQP